MADKRPSPSYEDARELLSDNIIKLHKANPPDLTSKLLMNITFALGHLVGAISEDMVYIRAEIEDLKRPRSRKRRLPQSAPPCSNFVESLKSHLIGLSFHIFYSCSFVAR